MGNGPNWRSQADAPIDIVPDDRRQFGSYAALGVVGFRRSSLKNGVFGVCPA